MASSSASTSTSTADGNCYQHDVFINHRGPDVKKTFASHLYRRLKAHGLRVFLDQEELQKGDNLTPQIKSAIRTASVHIAIFSTNYCQSRWCLDELVLMLESKRNLGSTIIPVFYDVKPSELRWTEGDSGVYTRALRMFKSRWWMQGEIGVYAQALRHLAEKKTIDYVTGELKLRYDSNTIRKWREALSDVADIIGFELEAYNDRSRRAFHFWLSKRFWLSERFGYPHVSGHTRHTITDHAVGAIHFLHANAKDIINLTPDNNPLHIHFEGGPGTAGGRNPASEAEDYR